MPIFADVDWGGQAWQDIAKQILSRQFATGDTRQNLIAVPEHIHRIKTQYFNKIAGISGRKFFTDEVIKNMIANPDYRKAKINEWLDEVAKGKKIIDDGLTITELESKMHTANKRNQAKADAFRQQIIWASNSGEVL